jgi:hypothetical protein
MSIPFRVVLRCSSFAFRFRVLIGFYPLQALSIGTSSKLLSGGKGERRALGPDRAQRAEVEGVSTRGGAEEQCAARNDSLTAIRKRKAKALESKAFAGGKET